jgi:homogentisate 1,2-dioxygenase
MPHYRRIGAVPAKRHTLVQPPWDDGTGTTVINLVPGDDHLHEELVGTEGFTGGSSLLYHRHSPSALVAVEALDPIPASDDLGVDDHPLLPRHLRTGDLPARDDLVTGRVALLVNEDVRISFALAHGASPLYRDARGDELVYVQSGVAVLESVFGRLHAGPGDYVVIPAGTTHRWVPSTAPVSALILEAQGGHIAEPRRYLTERGQLREGSPFSERDLRGPDDLPGEDGADVPVLVRHAGGWSRHVHRHHPFDVVGWDGCVYPWAFSILDFEPIVGTLHQPPPVHQTFEAPGFVVCSFTPRLYDMHPDAVKVPYHHANVDSDELLFYSAGDFMSRAGSGIDVGSISFHPAGFVHGPQPGSLERSLDQTRTDEVAVMVDTFRRLRVTAAARAISVDGYHLTWAERPVSASPPPLDR